MADVVALDEDGRIGLRDAAFIHEWTSEVALLVEATGAWLCITEAPRRHRGPAARLDGRDRLSVPLAWRRQQHLAVGSRLCLLTSPGDLEPVVLVTAASNVATAMEVISPFA